MIHELRDGNAPVGQATGDLYRRWCDGDVLGAAREGAARLAQGTLAEPLDYVLCSELAVSIGAIELSDKILARAETLEHPLLEVARARRLGGSQKLLAAADACANMSPAVEEAYPGLPDALRARYLAAMRRSDSARPLAEKEAADPLARICQAVALYELRAWRDVLSRTERLIDAYPRWARPYGLHAEALLALGDGDGARRTLADALEVCPGNRWVVHQAVFRAGLSDDQLEALAMSSPSEAPDGSPLTPPLAAGAAWVLALRGSLDAAIRVADRAPAELLERLVSAKRRPASRAAVPHRVIVQQDNTCVPTSVAMALGGQGIDVDPDRLYVEMGGATGVPTWRTDAWLQENGVAHVYCHGTVDTLRASVDAGAPLLVVRSGVMSSHMMLLVGYDDALAVFRIADPMGSGDQHATYESVEGGTAFDAAPIALFAGEARPHAAAFRATHEDRVAARAVAALRAAMELRTDDAVATFSALPEGHIERQRLAFACAPVFTREDRFVEVSRALAAHPECRPIERIRVLHDLIGRGETEAAAEVQETVPDLGPLAALSDVLAAWQAHDWGAMDAALDGLQEPMGASPALWWYRSISKNALGDYRVADEALRICLEIDANFPPAVREAVSGIRTRSLLEREARLRALLDADPLGLGVRFDLADVLVRLGRFEEGLAVVEEGVRVTPRSSGAYQALHAFWMNAGRPDRAAAVGLPDGSVDVATGSGEGAAVGGDLDGLLERVFGATPFAPDDDAVRALRELIDGDELGDADRFNAQTAMLVHYARMMGRGAHDPATFKALLPDRLPLPASRSYADAVYRLIAEDLSAPIPDALLDWGDALLGDDADADIGVRYARALLQVRAGRVASALPVLEQLAEDGLSAAYRELARLAVFDRQDQRAIDLLQKVVDAEPGDSASWSQLVALIARYDIAEAGRRAAKWLRVLPYDPSAFSTLHGLVDAREEGADDAHATALEAVLDDAVSRFSEVDREVWTATRELRRGAVPAAPSDAMREHYPELADDVLLVRAAEAGEVRAHEDVLRRHLSVDRSNPLSPKVVESLAADRSWLAEVALDVARDSASFPALWAVTGHTEPETWAAIAIELLTPLAERPAALDRMLGAILDAYGSATVAAGLPVARALTLAPSHAGVIALADALASRVGGLQVRRAAARRVLEHPGSLPVSRLAAIESMALVDPQRAIDQLEPLFRTLGGARPAAALADAYLSLGEWAMAVEVWENLLEAQPSNVEAMAAYLYLGGDVLNVSRGAVKRACQHLATPTFGGFAVGVVRYGVVRGHLPVAEGWIECATARLRTIGEPVYGWASEWWTLCDLVEKWYEARGETEKLEEFRAIVGPIRAGAPDPPEPSHGAAQLLDHSRYWTDQWIPPLPSTSDGLTAQESEVHQ